MMLPVWLEGCQQVVAGRRETPFVRVSLRGLLRYTYSSPLGHGSVYLHIGRMVGHQGRHSLQVRAAGLRRDMATEERSP